MHTTSRGYPLFARSHSLPSPTLAFARQSMVPSSNYTCIYESICPCPLFSLTYCFPVPTTTAAMEDAGGEEPKRKRKRRGFGVAPEPIDDAPGALLPTPTEQKPLLEASTAGISIYLSI